MPFHGPTLRIPTVQQYLLKQHIIKLLFILLLLRLLLAFHLYFIKCLPIFLRLQLFEVFNLECLISLWYLIHLLSGRISILRLFGLNAGRHLLNLNVLPNEVIGINHLAAGVLAVEAALLPIVFDSFHRPLKLFVGLVVCILEHVLDGLEVCLPVQVPERYDLLPFTIWISHWA